jgi:hypothetical protein
MSTLASCTFGIKNLIESTSTKSLDLKCKVTLRAFHPCASKGLGKPFDVAWQKNQPHPSCPGSSNLPGLFKLPAPLTILPGERCSCCAQIPGPHPLAIFESCHFWVEATLQGIFLTIIRVEEPVCKVRVGECHPKKI